MAEAPKKKIVISPDQEDIRGAMKSHLKNKDYKDIKDMT